MKKLFLGASKILKIHEHALAISPLSKISASLPPKNCKIFGSIYFPSIFDFQVVLMLNQLWLYRFIPHSFLMTMQGWWRIFLSFRISEFKYLRKKLSRPLLFNLYIYHCQEEISQTFSLSFFLSYREDIMLNSSLLRFHCRTRKLFTSSFIISPYISHTNNH